MSAPAETLRADPPPALLAALERRCFADPWSAELFGALMRRGTCRAWTLEAPGGEVRAYALVQRVADEAELLRIGVPPERRGNGHGRTLLAHVLEWARAEGIARLFLEVRACNAAARALYGAAGFRRSGLRAGYYRDPPDDALLLEWRPDPG